MHKTFESTMQWTGFQIKPSYFRFEFCVSDLISTEIRKWRWFRSVKFLVKTQQSANSAHNHRISSDNIWFANAFTHPLQNGYNWRGLLNIVHTLNRFVSGVMKADIDWRVTCETTHSILPSVLWRVSVHNEIEHINLIWVIVQRRK